MRSIYLICAKCGSNRINFESNIEDFEDNILNTTYICCKDCGTITSLAEYNEWVNTYENSSS